MNQFNVTGKLTNVSELNKTKTNGVSVIFTIDATTSDKHVVKLNCAAYDKIAKFIKNYCTLEDTLLLTGELDKGQKSGTIYVKVTNLQRIGKSNKNKDKLSESGKPKENATEKEDDCNLSDVSVMWVDEFDDLPF